MAVGSFGIQSCETGGTATDIFMLGYSLEMQGIYASRGITYKVVNHKIFWDWAVELLVENSVCWVRLLPNGESPIMAASVPIP